MKLKNELGNVKIIAIIAVIILVVILGIIFTRKSTQEKTVETVAKEAYEYFVLYAVDGNVGVVSKDGTTVVNPEYTNVYIPNQSKDVFFCVIDDDNYKILDKTGKELFKEFLNVSTVVISSNTMEMEKNVLTYEKDGRYGLIDYSGNIVTDAIYEDISSLPNKPGCLLVRKDGLYGVLDSNGNSIIDTKYNTIAGDEYSSEQDGYLRTGYIVSTKTETGILYGYIDYKGNVLIEPKYELITRPLVNDVEDDIYLVFREKGKRGVIKNKKVIMKPKYQFINYYDTSKIFIVTKGGKYGFYNLDGDEILPPEYTSYSVSGKYICVGQDERTMLYDLHGNLVNSNKYKGIQETGNPAFFIAQDKDGLYSIISKDKEISNNYKNVTYAFDNFFIFTNQAGQSGVLDVYSGIEVEAQYDYIIVLENAKALEAHKGNEVDIYSNIIEKVLTLSDAIVEKVDSNFTAVYTDTEMFYIDNTGKIVANTDVYKNADIYTYKNESDKWGFKNKSDEIVLETMYDFATEVNEYGFAGIRLKDKWGVVNKEGEIVVEPSYEITSYYLPKFVGIYLLEETEGGKYCIEVGAELQPELQQKLQPENNPVTNNVEESE